MSNQVLEEGVEGLNQDGQDERMSGNKLLRYARNDKQWWVALRLTHPTNSLQNVVSRKAAYGEREINCFIHYAFDTRLISPVIRGIF